jgi:serine/threonine-protein kinase
MQKIGRYQIEGELGRGAMGVVFLAFDPAIGRRVAVKTIGLDPVTDPEASAPLRARLLREAQSAGILSHPNIVTIYDIAEDASNAYIFMEFVDGPTLESFSRGMPTGELLAILDQAAQALDYAHARGIIHRDIKPANLMLAGSKLKITDFGVARLRKRDSTQSGSLLGTPSYMSPEQVAGGEVTGASDQYSLAVIAYEFLSGKRPFENENLATLLFKIAHEAPAPVASLPPAANDVLGQALAKDPNQRFPSCHAFIAALAASLGQTLEAVTPVRIVSGDEPTVAVPEAPAAPPPIQQLPPARHREPEVQSSRGIGFWFFFLLLLAGGSAGVWYFWLREQAPAVAQQTPPSPKVAEPSVTERPVAIEKPSPLVEEREAPEPVLTRPAPVPNPASSPSPAPASRPESPSAELHEVSFTSNPDRAEILINEGAVDRCSSTPCVLELPPGTYRVTAKVPDYPNVTRTLRVPGSRLMHLVFELPEGMIAINSNPPGATIRLDGQVIREKTPAMLKLKPGKYKVELIQEGMPSQSREITITNGTVQTLSVRWN